MTLLDDAPRTRTPLGTQVTLGLRLPWRDWGASLVAGVVAALAVWAIIMLPVLVGWLADPRSDAGLTDATAMSASIFGLAHRGPLLVDSLTVTFAPLLLLALAVLCCRYAATHVLRHRHLVPDGPVRSAREALTAIGVDLLGLVVLGYVAVGVGLGVLAGTGPAPVHLLLLVPGLLLVPVLGVAWSVWHEQRHAPNPAFDRGVAWIESRVPVYVQRSWKPAAQALLGLLAACTAFVIVLIVLQWERVFALYGVLDAGIAGIVVLTLAQLLAVPNLALWTLGFAAGAPLSIGSVQMGWVGTVAGELPLIPVLGALPEPGPLPALTPLVVLLPVLAGTWIGVRVAMNLPRLSGWTTKLLTSGAACLAVGVVVLLLGWLAAGSIAPGATDQVGTPALESAGLLTAEMVGGALLATSITHLVRTRRL